MDQRTCARDGVRTVLLTAEPSSEVPERIRKYFRLDTTPVGTLAGMALHAGRQIADRTPRLIALEPLEGPVATQLDTVRLFYQRSVSAAQLHSAGVAALVEFGVDDASGYLYRVFQQPQGQSLRNLVATRGVLGPRAAARIAALATRVQQELHRLRRRTAPVPVSRVYYSGDAHQETVSVLGVGLESRRLPADAPHPTAVLLAHLLLGKADEYVRVLPLAQSNGDELPDGLRRLHAVMAHENPAQRLDSPGTIIGALDSLSRADEVPLDIAPAVRTQPPSAYVPADTERPAASAPPRKAPHAAAEPPKRTPRPDTSPAPHSLVMTRELSPPRATGAPRRSEPRPKPPVRRAFPVLGLAWAEDAVDPPNSTEAAVPTAPSETSNAAILSPTVPATSAATTTPSSQQSDHPPGTAVAETESRGAEVTGSSLSTPGPHDRDIAPDPEAAPDAGTTGELVAGAKRPVLDTVAAPFPATKPLEAVAPATADEPSADSTAEPLEPEPVPTSTESEPDTALSPGHAPVVPAADVAPAPMPPTDQEPGSADTPPQMVEAELLSAPVPQPSNQPVAAADAPPVLSSSAAAPPAEVPSAPMSSVVPRGDRAVPTSPADQAVVETQTRWWPAGVVALLWVLRELFF